MSGTDRATAGGAARADWTAALIDRGPFLVACVMLVVLVAVYGSLQRGVFTLEELKARQALVHLVEGT